MPRAPIRVVFVLKARPMAKRGERPPGRRAEEPPEIEELMGALRAVPRARSIARAQKALGRHYAATLVSDGSDPADATAGLRVVTIELSARRPGMAFPRACAEAMRAMRLADARDPATGEPLLARMVYPSDARDEHGAFAALPSLHARLDWFRARMAEILGATSAEIDRAVLAGSCPPARDGAVKAFWL